VPVLEAYRSNSAKKDLMLSVSVCAHHSQSAASSTQAGAGLSRLLLKSSFSDPHSHNKCNLPSHFGHIKRSQPATRTPTPQKLWLLLSHFRGKCVKRSQFLCVNERTVVPFVILSLAVLSGPFKVLHERNLAGDEIGKCKFLIGR
jgi:hypothetical protein